jgi:hypothetical protein
MTTEAEHVLNRKLFIVFTLRRNEDLRGGSCEEVLNPLYYPM